MRKLLLLLMVLFTATLHAHVGSADVYYEGDAGPYHLFVTVKMPQVIPGVAEIQVRSSTNDVRDVEVAPMRLTGPGSNLPPIPDAAQRSKEDPQFFLSNVWLMESGALRVRIQVDGAKGKGELSVPVPSFARQSLPMNGFLRGLLGFFLLFLTVGVVLIAGAVVRESSAAPGEQPQPARRRRSRIVMAVTLIVVGLALFGSRAWWRAEAASYEKDVNFFKPPAAATTLQDDNLVIRAVGQDDRWSSQIKMEDVIADHGHLMHLFLVHTPSLDRMWHLHPERGLGGSFVQKLPSMPAGDYQVFADVVDKNGFPWTLVGTAQIPISMSISKTSGGAPSGDDSAWSGAAFAAPATSATQTHLSDGGRMVWLRDSATLKSNAPASLKFRVEEKDGSPARNLEPYMGMAAHAEIMSSDLSVFAHIHPAGSVSMAALELAQAGLGETGRTPMAMPMSSSSSGPMPAEFSFPYGFPRAGDYRIFIQIRRAGKVETAVFDAHVL